MVETVSVQGLTDLNTNLQNIQRTLASLSTILNNAVISLGGNNTFTGLNTFKIPPIINAGALGIGSFSPEGALSVQLSAAGVGNGADMTDDTLFTYALPANSLDQAQRGLRLTAFGKFANNGHDKTAKIFFGTSMVLSTGVVTTANLGWFLQMALFKTAAGAQLGFGYGLCGASPIAVPLTLVGTEADTNAITIKTTGASPTTGAANDVVGNGFVIEYLN